METVKNVIEKAIYGEQPQERSGEEPLSGVRGSGTTSDPYDAGNATGAEPVSGLQGQGTASDPYDAGNLSTHNKLNATQGESTLGGGQSGHGNTSSGTFGSTHHVDHITEQNTEQSIHTID